MFHLTPFGRKTQFKMAATITNYYAKTVIYSPITMQIINAIYGCAVTLSSDVCCLEPLMRRIIVV